MELLKKLRVFIAIYAVWIFINLLVLFLSDGNKDHFWPFCDNELLDSYDFSEFIVYVFGPLLVVFVFAMSSKKEK